MNRFREYKLIIALKPFLSPVRTAILAFLAGILNRYDIFMRSTFKSRNIVRRFELAMKWIFDNSVPNKGIISIIDPIGTSYPEVTGYFIPTLLNWGERELAASYKDWLLSVQNPDGSWQEASGKLPLAFDTGQVLKGLMALSDSYPEIKENIIRGCDWILGQQEETGRITMAYTTSWELSDGKKVPEAAHLYALEALKDAGGKWKIKRYPDAVNKALEYYLKDTALTDFNTLSHFHAYIIEALIDLGQTDRAREAMLEVAKLQKPNGFVPAYKGTDWVCSTGLFQYAIIWYKLSFFDNAERAFDYAVRLQNKSGGFYGGYGPDSNYFPNKEISWAVKYFLDAYYWKIKSFFNNKIGIFPATIEPEDGRIKKIRAFLGNMNGRKVLDVGCAKGRFLRVFKQFNPEAELYGLDLSEEMLKYCPDGVVKVTGSILNIPYPDGYFDCVYAVEALEHAIAVENGVRELCRVVKPGGRIVIIDKDAEKLGQMNIQPWEQWFSKPGITELMNKYGCDASYKVLSDKEYKIIDDIFVSWEGVKRS